MRSSTANPELLRTALKLATGAGKTYTLVGILLRLLDPGHNPGHCPSTGEAEARFDRLHVDRALPDEIEEAIAIEVAEGDRGCGPT